MESCVFFLSDGEADDRGTTTKMSDFRVSFGWPIQIRRHFGSFGVHFSFFVPRFHCMRVTCTRKRGSEPDKIVKRNKRAMTGISTSAKNSRLSHTGKLFHTDNFQPRREENVCISVVSSIRHVKSSRTIHSKLKIVSIFSALDAAGRSSMVFRSADFNFIKPFSLCGRWPATADEKAVAPIRSVAVTNGRYVAAVRRTGCFANMRRENDAVH